MHQASSLPSNPNKTQAKRRSWLLRQRLATEEQERRLECGMLSMILSMSSWGRDSMGGGGGYEGGKRDHVTHWQNINL